MFARLRILFHCTSEADRDKFKDKGCDANSVAGDPMFIDPANGDYRVKEGSPAFGKLFVGDVDGQHGLVRAAADHDARVPV